MILFCSSIVVVHYTHKQVGRYSSSHEERGSLCVFFSRQQHNNNKKNNDETHGEFQRTKHHNIVLTLLSPNVV